MTTMSLLVIRQYSCISIWWTYRWFHLLFLTYLIKIYFNKNKRAKVLKNASIPCSLSGIHWLPQWARIKVVCLCVNLWVYESMWLWINVWVCVCGYLGVWAAMSVCEFVSALESVCSWVHVTVCKCVTWVSVSVSATLGFG